jgi:LAO/AO transport system kinase
VSALYSYTGRAHTIGVTGSPGTGKSTLVNEIAKKIREQQLRVGIVAVDPSSPFTGGALLGDRVRMRDLSGDDGIFIRSMASRGRLGGLAQSTSDVVKILDAAGYEVILVETVGAGQAEVDISSATHTTLVVEAPGMGDEIQTIKAGILEIADILVVNKSDRPGSKQTVQALKMMLHMGMGSVVHHGRFSKRQENNKPDSDYDKVWLIPVCETIAIDGKGIDQLVDAIFEHNDHLQKSGEWLTRERARSRLEIQELLKTGFLDKLQAIIPEAERERVVSDVAERRIDPYTAVSRLFDQAGV